jgi:uncharacterized protein (TIGR02246 family)
MKKIFLLLLLPLIFQNAFSQDNDKQELTQLNRDLLNATVQKDTSALHQLFASDFISVAPNGVELTKSADIQYILRQQIESININNINVRLVTPDVGIVTCYTTYIFDNIGTGMTGKNCYQDVYVKRNGRWVAVADHVTLLSLR